MKFLLYISLFLSICLIIMGIVLTIYIHPIFIMHIIFGLILSILMLMVIIND